MGERKDELDVSEVLSRNLNETVEMLVKVGGNGKNFR